MNIKTDKISSDNFNTPAWYALYTVVRHEKTVNSALEKRNISSFLPMRNVVNRWKDRKKQIQIPLFPGYLFIHAGREDIYRSLNIRGVVRILGDSNGPKSIPLTQIEGIKKILENGMEFNTHPIINVGKEVVVNHGPLEGFRGKVIEKRGSYKLIISLDLIKRSVSVEVDIEDVELL